ncbi:MAG: ATP-binding protein [Chloroflexota bacterium]
MKQYTQEGDGLGLSIVREFVRLMNGTVDIQSQTGTTVSVTLPTSIPAITNRDY